MTKQRVLAVAVMLGHPAVSAKATSGLNWVDPFKAVKDLFVTQYSNAGLIILTLFGFAVNRSKEFILRISWCRLCSGSAQCSPSLFRVPLLWR